MSSIAEINFLDIDKNEEYIEQITKVLEKCFKEEKLEEAKLYVSITLTNESNIKKINKKYRNIDKETDVLSFPMFEKEELEKIIKNKSNIVEDILGDIIICIPKVQEQAIQYNHSFERELSYMVVHGFYHLMGYDHIEENDRAKMRPKEEKILQELNIIRET